MAKDGSIIIDTLIDTQGFNKGSANMQKSVGNLAGSVKKLGIAMAAAFSVKAIASFSKECIELGSDLQEVQNVVDVTFTTLSASVDKFAQSAAEMYGLSETMAKQFVGTFGAMSKSFNFAEDEAYEMATTLAGMAGDLASFYNISQDEAFTKLKSVFTGETETLKDLGVVMTQSALDAYAMANGYNMTTREMTEQQKVALRYKFVLDQLSAASGDFQRTSDGWANQMRVLKLNIDSIKASIGQGLINIFTPVIKVLNTVLSKLKSVANAFKEFTAMITGNKVDSSGAGTVATELAELESSYGSTADATDDLTDATKKSTAANKKNLSSLEELNVLSSNTGLSDTSQSGIVAGDLVTSALNPVEEVAEKAESKFGILQGKVKEFADALRNILSVFGSADAKRLGENIVGILRDAAAFAMENAAKLGSDIFTVFTQPIIDNQEKIKEAYQGIITVLADVSGAIRKELSKAYEHFGEVYDKKIHPFFVDFANDLSELGGKFLDWWNSDMQPVIERWGAKFSELWREHTAPLLNKMSDLFGKIFEYLSVLWNYRLEPFLDWMITYFYPKMTPIFEGIGNAGLAMSAIIQDAIGLILDAFGVLIDFMTATFTGEWRNVWDGLVSIATDSVKRALSIVESFVNAIIGAINGMFDKYNAIGAALPVLDLPQFPTISEISIPFLATGAVIPPNAPFAAVLGDQKNGTNIETPESLLRQIMREEMANINVKFEVEGDPHGLFKVTQKQANEYYKRTGRPAYPM